MDMVHALHGLKAHILGSQHFLWLLSHIFDHWGLGGGHLTPISTFLLKLL